MFSILLLLPLLVHAAKNPKRGIAWPVENGGPLDLAGSANSVISWEYNWAKNAPPGLPSGIEHVPMQWDERDIAGLGGAIGSAKFLLGFNEPERPEQAAISPSDAARLWKDNIQPLSPGVKLGAPAVAAGPAGQQWLDQFFAACSGCTFDFLPIHWYGEGAQNFNAYVAGMRDKYQKPIWVTEFAPTAGDVMAFMRDTLNFLDNEPSVERYAWFAYTATPPQGLQSGLLNGNGLNELGNFYVNNA
ncbi:glycosyl hydrolase 53 domain-containing protein [Moniliophthora roreri MCA 2997]|uniref:Glycosyl hydrolase 53 domain-containing protein n=2 Tax=Moniliophthora roreri TaxID=221103 RepID=V2WRY7_MONRO|nr:glycosyl hydrolase 53 domain-containing protein [Moniliophthora roreri MCA 2997]